MSSDRGGLVLPAGVTPGVGLGSGQLVFPLDGGDSAEGALARYPLIGLAGRKFSGKDTLGSELMERFGYTRVAFADAVRDLALAIDPRVGVDRLSAIVKNIGWDEAKRLPEVRRLLQHIGGGVRDVIHEDVWIAKALEKIDAIKGPVVVTDVRYQNEAEIIGSFGGVIIFISRPNGPVDGNGDDHASETEIESTRAYDMHIVNDGTVEDLRSWAAQLDGYAGRYGRVVPR